MIPALLTNLDQYWYLLLKDPIGRTQKMCFDCFDNPSADKRNLRNEYVGSGMRRAEGENGRMNICALG